MVQTAMRSSAPRLPAQRLGDLLGRLAAGLSPCRPSRRSGPARPSAAARRPASAGAAAPTGRARPCPTWYVTRVLSREPRDGQVAGEVRVGLGRRPGCHRRDDVFRFVASGFAPDVRAGDQGRQPEHHTDCLEPADSNHGPNPLVRLGEWQLFPEAREVASLLRILNPRLLAPPYKFSQLPVLPRPTDRESGRAGAAGARRLQIRGRNVMSIPARRIARFARVVRPIPAGPSGLTEGDT